MSHGMMARLFYHERKSSIELAMFSDRQGKKLFQEKENRNS